MSEAPGAAPVEISRVWKYTGEGEGVVHLQLRAGDDVVNINLRKSRNPRLFEFVVGHASIGTEERPPKEDKSDDE